ncbi:hypothetical protein ACJMK2_023569 [Sinanodonta woodiana]|uniref:Uncharacterized protein n=1 Tax=Sinanodonta woodiana TaxID=1069815 RepID=A0ABD3T4P4_SINWO
MDIEKQQVLIYEAEKACNETLNTRETSPIEDGLCKVVWDGIMCWSSTANGSIARERCPHYIIGFNPDGIAERECQANGSWKENPLYNSSGGWTDFSGCILKNDQEKFSLNHMSQIRLMYNIGYGLSLVSLIFAVIIISCCRRLYCKSNTLHINLFLAFILRATVSFIKDNVFVNDIGLTKDVIFKNDGRVIFNEEVSHWECKLLYTIFTYCISVSYMWIFVEGLYLHMVVYRTLFTERHGIRIYIVLGWALPFTFIIPWMVVRITLEDKFCWNMNETPEHFWIIKGPIIFLLVINFIFFIEILRVLVFRVKSNRKTRRTEQIRKLGKFLLVLVPLLGVPYIVFAAYHHGLNPDIDIIHLYCEMFYNSFQGLLLSLLFCFLNEEVYSEVLRCCRKRKNRLQYKSTMLTSIRHGGQASRSSADVARTNSQSHSTGIGSEHTPRLFFNDRNAASTKDIHFSNEDVTI